MRVDAHHSFAMFDYSKSLHFEGTIKEVRWTNPHVAVFLVTDAAQEWLLETTSPGNLTRYGWSRHWLNTGDKVAIDFNCSDQQAQYQIKLGSHPSGERTP